MGAQECAPMNTQSHLRVRRAVIPSFGAARFTRHLLAVVLAAASLGAALAAAPKAEPSAYDKIWSYADLYKNEENPVVQRVQFTGRFQLDYSVVDAEQGDHDEWNVRRFRLGTKAKLFQDFTLHGEVDLNPQEPRPLYQRMTDMYLAWSRGKSFVATVGKHGALFTLDGSTSSKELLTIDRNNLANNVWFPNEYFPGISVSGQQDQWRYFGGVFTSGEANPEFGEFNGGVFFLGTLAYDFKEALHVKQAYLAANYVYNEPDLDNSWTRNLQHIASLNFSFDTGKWGVRSDVSAGQGYLGSSDLWGAVLMPFYNLTDKLQIIGRYTHVSSDKPNGVRLNLYENLVVSGRGDEYNEFYFGLNYFFYGHKLKVQTGVQYAEMKDRARDRGAYDGWAWTTGLRIGW
jgi:phosphate-selective porin OprO and OprP